MSSTVDITMPSGQQEGTQSFVSKWLKKPGDPVSLHEPILEISTDKVIMEIAAPADGVLKGVAKNENDQVEPGEILGVIDTSTAGSPAAKARSDARVSAPRASAAADSAVQELSPAVKRLLQEHNLHASAMRGTGKGGRITHQDVLDHVARMAAQAKPAEGGQPSGRRVPHTPMRKSIANHMVQSMLHTAPHVTTVFEADLTKVLRHRETIKADYEKQSTRLTLTAYFVQAAITALKAVPEVNSRWHDDGLELFDQLNIGIATALGSSGLMVPVIRDAQELDLFATARVLQDLTEKTRSGVLSAEHVRGGTFTITNHGVSGSLIATPIINQPQSAILGIGKLEKRVKVVLEDGQEVARIRPVVYVTLTIDHRVLDGFQANTFLGIFVNALENWEA